MKLAAIEAEWETHEPPAGFNVIAFPDQEKGENSFQITLPWALGLIATRSVTEEVIGINDLKAQNEERVRNGIEAYAMLMELREAKNNGEEITDEQKAAFDAIKKDLGYGLLLKPYTDKVVDATEEQIQMAVDDTVPAVAPLFWVFRIMVAAGMIMLILFVLAFYYTANRTAFKKKWLLRFAFFSLPLPWIAIESGWFVAEFGRQPWAIGEILPTAMGVSSLSVGDLVGSIIGFVLFYTVLLVVEMYLMIKFAKQGPSCLHTGRYHFEKGAGDHHHDLTSTAYADKVKDPV